MQNYWNNISQPVNYQNRPVKKEEKNEKLKKAVTYTLGALAGVGAAALIGYGIINKSQGKKVVDKAKDAASEVAKKGKDKINPSSPKKGKEVLFKVLADIKNGQNITLQDLKTARATVSMIVPSDEKYKQVVSKYLVFLESLINKHQNETGEFKVEEELKKNADALEQESQNILTQVFAQADFEAYLKNNNIDLNNIEVNAVTKGLVLINKSTKSKINLTPKSKVNLEEMVLLDEAKHIYVEKDKEIKDDTQLYILHNNEYYTITAGDLKELADVKTIQDDDIINKGAIDSFGDDSNIVKCKKEGETYSAFYIYGVKNASDETKYIKISDLTSANLALLVDKNVFSDIVKCNDVKTETWSAVFNNNTDNKVVKTDGALTDAGNLIMAALNEKIDKAGDDEKATIISDLLSKIDAAKFGDKSVGKAVVQSLIDDENISASIWGKVLNDDATKKLFDTDKNTFTNAGNALMEGIKARIEKAGEDDEKVTIISGLLSKIDAAKFGDKSVGKAVVQSLIDDENISASIWGKVLNDDATKKLFDTDKNTFTNAGNALMEGIKARIEKAGEDDDKATIISGLLSQIDDTKFGENSVGKAVVQSLIDYENISADVLLKVLENNADNKLVDTTQEDNKKLKPLGQALLIGYLEKSGKTFNSIEYYSPSIRITKSISKISISDLTLKYYTYDTNTIRYFFKTKKS